MDTYNHEKEISEAIAAGERALHGLQEAQSKMDSARNWGLFDIIGGSFISGMMNKEIPLDTYSRREHFFAPSLIRMMFPIFN